MYDYETRKTKAIWPITCCAKCNITGMSCYMWLSCWVWWLSLMKPMKLRHRNIIQRALISSPFQSLTAWSSTKWIIAFRSPWYRICTWLLWFNFISYLYLNFKTKFLPLICHLILPDLVIRLNWGSEKWSRVD